MWSLQVLFCCSALISHYSSSSQSSPSSPPWLVLLTWYFSSVSFVWWNRNVSRPQFFFLGRCTPFRYSSWSCTCRMLVLLDQSEQTIRGVDTFLQLLQRIFIFTDFNVIDPSEQFRLKGSYRPFYGTFPILAPSSISLSLMSSRIFSLGTPCWIFAASSCLFPFGSHVCWMSLVWPEWV